MSKNPVVRVFPPLTRGGMNSPLGEEKEEFDYVYFLPRSPDLWEVQLK